MQLRMLIGATGLVLAASAFATPGQAQGVSAQCPAGAISPAGLPNHDAIVQDACQKAIDLFQYMAPQLGVTIAGGNATIGVGGTIGGLGHIYLSGRANIVQSDLPQVDQVTPSVTGAQRSTYPTTSQIIGIPEADASIGIFRGIPMGLTNVGGLDLLVSASYLPSFSSGSFDVRVPNGSLKFGGGARLGLIQETPFLPGIAVTYLRRGLPTVDLVAMSGNDTLRVTGVNVTTDAVRLVVSKNLFLLGLAAGVGEDRYDSRASVSAYVAPRTLSGALVTTPETVGPYALKQTLNRTTYFIDGSVNLAILRIIGEIGHTTANSIPTYNSFSGSPAGAARTYGAVGVRLGI